MKTIEIGAENAAQWERSRTACRGLVLEDGKLLLSYGANRDIWMIPGGGMESGESDAQCCAREVREETGFLVDPAECVLEIVDYFRNVKMINRYFPAALLGRAERSLTEMEENMGMEPRWLPIEEAKAVFSHYDDYAGENELRRSLYRREYTALCEIFK